MATFIVSSYPKTFKAQYCLRNGTTHTLTNIEIVLRSNDKNKSRPCTAILHQLLPNITTDSITFDFGTDKPSVARNVFCLLASAIATPLVAAAPLIAAPVAVFGGAAVAIKGWGKDYWSISFDKDGVRYSTDHDHVVRWDVWFADVAPGEGPLDMTISANGGDLSVSLLRRTKGGISTRDFEIVPLNRRSAILSAMIYPDPAH